MSTEIIPIPEDEPRHGDDGGPRRTETRKKKASIPTREDCLKAIAALNGLVAANLMDSRRADSIRKGYEAILREHNRARKASAQMGNDDVLRIWRSQPELIDLIEPLLTDTQIEMIMREAGSGNDRQA